MEPPKKKRKTGAPEADGPYCNANSKEVWHSVWRASTEQCCGCGDRYVPDTVKCAFCGDFVCESCKDEGRTASDEFFCTCCIERCDRCPREVPLTELFHCPRHDPDADVLECRDCCPKTWEGKPACEDCVSEGLVLLEKPFRLGSHTSEEVAAAGKKVLALAKEFPELGSEYVNEAYDVEGGRVVMRDLDPDESSPKLVVAEATRENDNEASVTFNTLSDETYGLASTVTFTGLAESTGVATLKERPENEPNDVVADVLGGLWHQPLGMAALRTLLRLDEDRQAALANTVELCIGE